MNTSEKLVYVGTIVSTLVLAVVATYFTTFNDRAVTCTVTGKDRSLSVVDGQSRSSMRVYTQQCDVLQVQDKFLRGKFQSASTWGVIEVGRTYEFQVVGVRWFNTFPTILEARELNL